jgi:anti-repressor protein
MELIQINTAVAVGTEVIQTVNARELHGFLGNGKMFAHWIKDRIEKYGFTDGVDYTTTLLPKRANTPGRPGTDYHVSIDMAKELAMVERNDQGRKARQYFIECEKKLKEAAPSALPSFPEALRMLADSVERESKQALQITQQAVQIEAAAPAVEFVEKYVSSEGLRLFRQVAKLLHAPETEFRNFLVDHRFMKKMNGAWVVYQPHLTAGRFEQRERIVDGTARYVVYFTPKGVEYVAKKWNERTPLLRKPLTAPKALGAAASC